MSKTTAKLISDYLFSDNRFFVYAVLDGASVPDLLEALYREQPEYFCLYRGELEPDIAEVAPYLVWLTPDSRFTNWLLEEGWGKSWGVFALSGFDLVSIRRHFRSLLVVHDGDGKPLYFRFYDPRVLRRFLPTCDKKELKKIFGHVESYIIESENAKEAIQYHNANGTLKQNKIRLMN